MTENGYLVEVELPNGLMAAVMPLTFGRARIVAGPKESWAASYEDGW